MISIIVPVYNSENYLDICVESIFAQKYDCWELILVDDGSTDGSPGLCDKFSIKDKRVITVHTENRGASYARNVGINMAHGEYLMFVDSDDYIGPNYLNEFVKYSDSDFVVGGYTTFGIMDRQISLNYVRMKLENNWREIDVSINNPRINAIYHICGKLYHTKVIKNNSIFFPENMKLAEDTCFNLSYIQNCKEICFITEQGYYYRMNNMNNKYMFNFAEFERHVKIFSKYCENFSLNTGYRFSFVNNSILMSFLIALNNEVVLHIEYKDFIERSKQLIKESLLPTSVKCILNTREKIIYNAYKQPYWGFLYVKLDRWIYSFYMLAKAKYKS